MIAKTSRLLTIGVCSSLPFFGFSQSDDIQELKALVSSLQAQVEQYHDEVQSLKTQLSSKERVAVESQKIRERISGVTSNDVPVKSNFNSKYDFRFYGYFKADFFHDSAQTSHQEIPLWVVRDNDGGETDFTARQTRFGFDTTATDINGGTLLGKLEMDFFGKIPTFGDVSGNHGYQLRTRHAYLQWKNEDWTVIAGKTFEAYSMEFPDTLNFGYYNMQGLLGHRRMQLRVSRFIKLGENTTWEVTGAVDEPVGGVHGGDIDGDGLDDGTDSEFPGVIGRTKLTFPGIGGRPTTLGFSAFYAKESVYDRDYDSIGTVLTASIPFSDVLSLKGSIWQGENLDAAWGGIGQGINPVLRREIAANGGWVQLKVKPSAKWWFNVGYSVDDPDDEDLNLGQRAKNSSILFNTYYKVADPLLVAFEYFMLETEYKGAETVDNNRIMGSVIFHF